MNHLNLFGPVNTTGMGIHFTNWAAAMVHAVRLEKNLSIAVIPRGPLGITRGARLSKAEQTVLEIAQRADLFEPDGTSIYLWHPNEVACFAGKHRLQYTVFETTHLRPHEARLLKKVDKWIVPTDWHKDRLKSVYNIDALVIPEGVDPQLFSFGETGLRSRYWAPSDPDDMITFVSVGKLEKRKGIVVALDAMIEAANRTPEKNFRLLAHWFNPFLLDPPYPQVLNQMFASKKMHPSEESLLQKHEVEGTVRYQRDDLPNLIVDVITNRLPTHDRMAEIYRAGHFGLFPFFAEGWCLPLHESMSCGLPPLCQYYSGPTQYLRKGSFIELNGTEAVALDGMPHEDGRRRNQFFFGDAGTWSQTNTESTIAAIILAAHMTKEERQKIGAAASEAALRFTWDDAARKTITTLRSEGLIR